jgi:hypothetical protein
VTAGDAKYFARLANLVGSLQFWEPGVSIALYDLGLGNAYATAARRWAGVEYRRLPPRNSPVALPAHLYDEVALVGWKFWVALDALERADAIFWLDANAEVRRPLDSVRAALAADGHFLTVAGHRFPTEKTVRPATLGALQCGAIHAARPECTSAYLGVASGSTAHHALLPLARACAHDRACLYPGDAVGNDNNRRDQSALNAALCALAARGVDLDCRADRRFWMWNGQRAFPPPDRADEWSDMVLFSRRGPGPYAPSNTTAPPL